MHSTNDDRPKPQFADENEIDISTPPAVTPGPGLARDWITFLLDQCDNNVSELRDVIQDYLLIARPAWPVRQLCAMTTEDLILMFRLLIESESARTEH